MKGVGERFEGFCISSIHESLTKRGFVWQTSVGIWSQKGQNNNELFSPLNKLIAHKRLKNKITELTRLIIITIDCV